jgi:hypothetical protein
VVGAYVIHAVNTIATRDFLIVIGVMITVAMISVVRMMAVSWAVSALGRQLRGPLDLLLLEALHTWRISTFRNLRRQRCPERPVPRECPESLRNRGFLIRFWVVHPDPFRREERPQWGLGTLEPLWLDYRLPGECRISA